MVKPINHYSLENPATIYDEEAMTVLELVGRTAAKVNETVGAFNDLEEKTNDHLQAQDEEISDRMDAQDAAIPVKVAEEVKHYIDNGEFDAAIDEYAGKLSQQLDNLLGSVEEGSTTLDAELIDIRAGIDGTNYGSAGEAVRGQLGAFMRVAFPMATTNPKINFDTENGIISSEGTLYAITKGGSYPIAPFELDYASVGNVLLFCLDKSVAPVENNYTPVIVKPSAYDASKHVAVFAFVANALTTGHYACTLPFEYMINGNYLPETSIQPVYGVLFSTQADFAYSFDRENRLLTVPSCYVAFGEERYDFEGTRVLEIPEGNTKYLVVEKAARTLNIINGYGLDVSKQIPIMLFNMDYLTLPASNNIDAPYYVDGVLYNRFNAGASSGGGAGDVYAYLAAGANIQTAVDNGATVIVLQPGTYSGQQVDIRDKKKLHIYVTDTGYDARKMKKNAVIDNSITILAESVYDYPTTSNWYSVFDSGALPPVREGLRSESYNAILWECDVENPGNDVKLVPVTGKGEYTNSAGGVFYVNSRTGSVEIKPHTERATNTYRALRLEEGSLFTVENVQDFYMENVEIKYAPEYAKFTNIGKCELRNCVVSHTAYSGGFSVNGTNGSFHGCEAYKVCSDGFGIGGSSNGYTEYFDCSGHHCYDDGISHHNGSAGAIYGGEWHHNTKAGVAPAHGAMVNIYGAISHDNGYGFYIESDDTVPEAMGRSVRMSGCTAFDNNIGLSVRNYHVLACGCNVATNTTPTSVVDNDTSSLTQV